MFVSVTREVSFQFLQHPDYGLYNDIAVLEVDGEVAIDGTFVDTIALAPADAEDFVGAECEIAGWGQTEGNSPCRNSRPFPYLRWFYKILTEVSKLASVRIFFHIF